MWSVPIDFVSIIDGLSFTIPGYTRTTDFDNKKIIDFRFQMRQFENSALSFLNSHRVQHHRAPGRSRGDNGYTFCSFI